MKKRILSALLCLCMVMALMPTVAFAEPTSYNLWVGGVEVTSDNASNITGEGITGTVTYDDSTKTLTLNNVNIDSVYSFENGVGKDSAGIYVSGDFNGDLTIKLVGENTITGKLTDPLLYLILLHFCLLSYVSELLALFFYGFGGMGLKSGFPGSHPSFPRPMRGGGGMTASSSPA